jgi:hypothetical protein
MFYVNIDGIIYYWNYQQAGRQGQKYTIDLCANCMKLDKKEKGAKLCLTP